MRDTMELVTSLGYMFLKRESLDTEETLQEDIIQIPETSVTLEKAPFYSEPFTIPCPEISEGPRCNLSGSKTTVIQKQLENSFNKAQKTLEERPHRPNTQTAFIHEMTTEGKAESIMTGPRIQRLEDAFNPSCNSGPVLCGSGVNLLMEGDQLATPELLPDSEYLTVIKVEEINVAIKSEVMSLHRDGWEIHPDNWNREEHWDLQGGAVYPLALTSPHHTMNSHLPWTESHGVFSLGPLQRTEKTPFGSGQCVEGGGAWTTLDDQQMSTPEYTENHKCSICSRSFLQSPDHHERVEKKTFTCPTCYSHLITAPPQHTHLPPLLRDGQTDTDSTPQPSQDKQNFMCPRSKGHFSQLIGLHRPQNIHMRNKTPVKSMAPPQRKVYGAPTLQATEPREVRSTIHSTGEAYSKLHHHLQLSTTFLQQLLTSTCGFQYD